MALIQGAGGVMAGAVTQPGENSSLLLAFVLHSISRHMPVLDQPYARHMLASNADRDALTLHVYSDEPTHAHRDETAFQTQS